MTIACNVLCEHAIKTAWFFVRLHVCSLTNDQTRRPTFVKLGRNSGLYKQIDILPDLYSFQE